MRKNCVARAAKTPRVLVYLSDLHCGSKKGLLPPGCKDEDGAEYALNPFQRWLWNRWIEATEEWAPSIIKDDPFDLVVGGDVVEGVHHKTTEVVDADAAAHGAIAVAALQPLADRAERCWMVRGTEAHTKTSEHHIGKGLGCEPDPDTGSYAWPQVLLVRGEMMVSAAHHMSTSLRPWTEASALGIALNSERLEMARAGLPLPRVVLRAHRHVFGTFSDAYGMIVCSPCWQGATRFVEKVKPDAVACVGMVILDFRNRMKGELPDVRFFAKPYPKGC